MIYKYGCNGVLPLFDTEDAAIEWALDIANRSEWPRSVTIYKFESLDGDKWQVYKIVEIREVDVHAWSLHKAERRS